MVKQGGGDPPAPAAEWTTDLEKMTFPQARAVGKLGGKPFQPDRVEFQGGILRLRTGKEFFADQEVQLFFFLPSKEVSHLVGKKFHVKPTQQPGEGTTVHVHASVKKEGENVPKTEMYLDKFALKVEFDELKDDQLPGRIYLSLPDQDKSLLAGTFVAEVNPDLADPARPKDAPFLQGTVTIPKQKGELAVGYDGENARGESQVNMVGTGVDPENGSGGAQSDTFKPRVTRFGFDKDRTLRYVHAKLDPGWYLVYARWGPQFLAWRWLEVKDGAQTTLDFALDPSQAGKLEIKTTAPERVQLLPLNEEGKLPSLKQLPENLAFMLRLEVEPKDGVAAFTTLHPGKYRVIQGKASKDVEIKAGETAKVTLP